MEINKKEMFFLVGFVFLVGLFSGSYWMKQSSQDTIDYISSTYKERINILESLNLSYEKCLDKKITERMEIDIVERFMNGIDECFIMSNYTETTRESDNLTTGRYSNQHFYSPCSVWADWWGDGTTSILIDEDKSIYVR